MSKQLAKTEKNNNAIKLQLIKLFYVFNVTIIIIFHPLYRGNFLFAIFYAFKA